MGANGEGQNYQLSLSSEPSGISSYMHLHLDTGLRTQDFGFEMNLPANVVGEMRVRQYDMAGSERYSDAIRWTRLNNTGLQNCTLAVDKSAVSNGGKTLIEWKFTTPNGSAFPNGTNIAIKKPWLSQYQWTNVNQVVTVCDEKDGYRFGFNGMEKDNEVKGKGNSLDFGARIYDSRLGRWLSIDPLAAKYPDVSTFTFALNTPIQAKDPDGRVVIFISGQHAGDGGQAKYWGGLDNRVMNRIGDFSARYVDGALGGWSKTVKPITSFGWPTMGKQPSNLSMHDRIVAGEVRGYLDGKAVIESLSAGETIKIVTHNMGSAFARGYIEGLQFYADKNNLYDNVKFEFIVDINAYQGKDVPKPTQLMGRYNKTGGLDGKPLEAAWEGKIGVISVAPVPGSEDITVREDKHKGHAVGEMSDEAIPTSSHNSLNGTKENPCQIEEGVDNKNGNHKP